MSFGFKAWQSKLNKRSKTEGYLVDEVGYHGRNSVAAMLGPISSSFTLAWLAAHRGRLRSILLGGRRLTIVVAWDTGWRNNKNFTTEEAAAIRDVVLGPLAPGDR